MKKTLATILILSFFISTCTNKESTNENDQENTEVKTFENPILSGFNPDPSICRVGNDFYMVNSTFGYFPGIPVLHSKDLVNWEQIGAVLDSNHQMNLDEQRISRGFFAPAISYNDGWFYVICTLIDGYGNFISKSKNPGGPYSEPYWLPDLNGGIDPSLFFDEDGSTWIVYNHTAPDNDPLYSGHRTIRMRELDLQTMKLKGDEILLVNGGVDLSKEPVWIEAPHIYKINGMYYLMCAEGGTSYNHSEVIFRSESLTGPYVPGDKNPIITQRHLDPTRENPITSAGHADMVELPSGEWWAVFLACRPYEGGHYNTGRETFLAPVKWENGWPEINPDFDEIQSSYPMPDTEEQSIASVPLSGKFTYRVEFDEPLDPRWMFLRNVRTNWYNLDEEAGTISIDLRPQIITVKDNPSLLLRRQTHITGEVSTFISFQPQTENEMAGLVVLQNETHYYFINKTAEGLQLLKMKEEGMETLAEVAYQNEGVHLKIKAKGNKYDFLFSDDGKEYTPLAGDVDATYLSTETAGGFVGCMYGLYATSNGEESSNQAKFGYFEIINQ